MNNATRLYQLREAWNLYTSMGFDCVPISPRSKLTFPYSMPSLARDRCNISPSPINSVIGLTDKQNDFDQHIRTGTENIGILVNSHIVVDVDRPKLFVEWANRKFSGWRDTLRGVLTTRTGRGYHLHFASSSKVKITNRGFPFKSLGFDLWNMRQWPPQHVLMPPSIHPNGRVYEWGDATCIGEDSEITPDACQRIWLMELPGWLHTTLANRRPSFFTESVGGESDPDSELDDNEDRYSDDE